MACSNSNLPCGHHTLAEGILRNRRSDQSSVSDPVLYLSSQQTTVRIDVHHHVEQRTDIRSNAALEEASLASRCVSQRVELGSHE
jgi:hypothetical protein